MKTQTEAERLADALTTAVKQIDEDDQVVHFARWFVEDSAAELRRLASFNQQLMDEVARLKQAEPLPVKTYCGGKAWHVAPTKNEWVRLTDEEVIEISHLALTRVQAVRMTEAKLKEKHT